MPNTREKLIELQKAAIREFMSSTTDVPLTDFTADYLIANGVTINRGTEDTPVADNLSPTGWIPVTERLPEANEKVLICTGIGNLYVAQHLRGHFYLDGSNICTTHWMPLPEPPKED